MVEYMVQSGQWLCIFGFVAEIFPISLPEWWCAVLVECMVQSGQWLGWRRRLLVGRSRLSAGEEAIEAAAADKKTQKDKKDKKTKIGLSAGEETIKSAASVKDPR